MDLKIACIGGAAVDLGNVNSLSFREFSLTSESKIECEHRQIFGTRHGNASCGIATVS